MEHVMDASINVKGQQVEYLVKFVDEAYVFEPKEGGDAPTFSFAREHNDWIPKQPLDEDVSKQALTELERYLLSQH